MVNIRQAIRRTGFDLVRYPSLTESEGGLRHIVHTLGVKHVIDVGANIGQFGSWFRNQIGYTGRIDSFEPGRVMFDELSRMAAGDPQWHVHRAALSDTPGEVTLNIYPDSTLSSVSAPSEEGRAAYLADWIGVTETVPARRLSDEDLPDLGSTYLKVDTQGHDWSVLLGAGQVLDRVSVLEMELSFVKLYESSRSAWETIRDLEELGFGLAHLMPITRHEGELRLLEADGYFVRKRLRTG